MKLKKFQIHYNQLCSKVYKILNKKLYLLNKPINTTFNVKKKYNNHLIMRKPQMTPLLMNKGNNKSEMKFSQRS